MRIVLFMTYIFCLSKMQGDGLPLYYHWFLFCWLMVSSPLHFVFFFRQIRSTGQQWFFASSNKTKFRKLKVLAKSDENFKSPLRSRRISAFTGGPRLARIWSGMPNILHLSINASPHDLYHRYKTPQSICEDQDVPSISFSSGDPFGYLEAKMGGDLFHTTYFRPHCWIPITGNSSWRRLPASAGDGLFWKCSNQVSFVLDGSH